MNTLVLKRNNLLVFIIIFGVINFDISKDKLVSNMTPNIIVLVQYIEVMYHVLLFTD